MRVSFDRPYSNYGDGGLMASEVYFVRWLERSGYDVSYSTDVDTHVRGARLRRHRALLSVGHDEYWTKEMYDAAEAARDAGVHLGFFGADAVYRYRGHRIPTPWATPDEPRATTRPGISPPGPAP